MRPLEEKLTDIRRMLSDLQRMPPEWTLDLRLAHMVQINRIIIAMIDELLPPTN